MTDYLIKEDVFMALTGDITDCTIEEFIARLRDKLSKLPSVGKDINVTTNEDCISRQEAINCVTLNEFRYKMVEDMKTLPSVTPKEKIGYCKDCKWWKDNDGVYRRGVGAESKCPINRKEVYEGNGYCFMFEPQESEDKK